MSATYTPMTQEEQDAADAEIRSWGSIEGWYCLTCQVQWGLWKPDFGMCPQCGASCALRFDDGECIITDIMPDGTTVQTDACDDVEDGR